MLETQTRREFLLLLSGGLVGVTLLDAFGQERDPPATPLEGAPLFSLRTINGSDLLFYGVNVERRHHHLRPVAAGQSYLIMQIPGQSLHEYAHYAPGDTSPPGQQRAWKSGPSFLVFELWPQLQKGRSLRRKLDCTLSALLAWDDMTRFRLVAANEPALAKLWPSYRNSDAARSIEEITGTSRPRHYSFAYYNWLLKGLLHGQHSLAVHPPVSVIDAPAGSLLSFLLRRPPHISPTQIFQGHFVTNGHALPGTTARQCYPFTRAGVPVHRSVTEGWQAYYTYGATATPWVTQPPQAYNVGAPAEPAAALADVDEEGKGAPTLPTPEKFQLGLRLLGYLQPPIGNERPKKCEDEPVTEQAYLLPSPEDLQQLLVLNQLASSPGAQPRDCPPNSGEKLASDFLAERFDIKVPSAFILGGRGGSFKYHYSNYDTATLPASISLVEYEHHIQDGIDNFIKVAHIGVVAPVDLKAVHVRQARRIIRGGRSFMEYKESIEFVESDKEFALAPRADTSNSPFVEFEEASPGKPGVPKHFKPAQLCFRRVAAPKTPMPNIDPMGACSAEERKCFWVRKEGSQPIGNPAHRDAYDNLIQVPFRYYDANGHPISEDVSHTIQFLRRDFFGAENCDEPSGANANIKSLLKDPTSSFYLGNKDDGRYRLPLHGKVIALTEDAPPAPNEAGLVSADDEALNKPNRLATDWVEYYYHVVKPSPDPNVNIFDTAEHIIYPQIRQIKAYIDHVQGFSAQKLPSLLEYEEQFLATKFAGPNRELRLMLRHTDAFLQQELRQLNGVVLRATDDVRGRYADLHKGITNIRAVFSQPGRRLGGIANPDPVLARVAGTAQNIGLPAQKVLGNVSELLQKARRPIEILNGDAAELFGGIKLVSILRESLDPEETPQFAQNKFNADLEALADTVNSLKNPVIKQTLDAVNKAQTVINDLQAKLATAQALLPTLQQGLQQARARLAAQLPDLDRLKTLAMVRLEEARVRFITEIKASAPVEEVQRQLAALRFALVGALDPYVNAYLNVAPQADAARAQLVRLSSPYFLPTNWALAADTAFSTLLEEIIKTVVEAVTPAALVGSEAARELARFTKPKARADTQAYLVAAGQQVVAELQKVRTDVERAAQMRDLTKALLGSVPAELPAQTLASVTYLIQQYDALRKTYLESVTDSAKLLQWDRALGLVRLSIQREVAFHRQHADQLRRQADDLLRTSRLLTDIGQDAVDEWVKNRTDCIDSSKLCYQQLLDTYHLSPTAAEAAIGNLLRLPELDGEAFETIKAAAWDKLKKTPAYKALLEPYELALDQLDKGNKELARLLEDFQLRAEAFAKGYLAQVEAEFRKQVARLPGAGQIQEAVAAYEEVRRFLQTPVRQELKYDWQTKGFTDVNLGFIRFIPQREPATALRLHSSTTVQLDASHLPAVQTSIQFNTDTQVTDFAIGFLGVLNVDFERVSFKAGSGRSPDLDVRIRGVRFEGPLAFIQALQDLLAGLIDAFLSLIQEQKVTIAYQSPTFGVSAPGFMFTDISFGITLDLYFNRKPLLLNFRLALPERKATVAAGILGGKFYCSLSVSPTQGIVGIEMALEMGAILGFSLGPARGEVRFMAGLYYRKLNREVTMEGYFIAEGTLKVWIVSVSARLYMGVRSQGSYVEGKCLVSYSFRVGIVKKGFSKVYKKQLAGASSRPRDSGNPSKFQQQLAAATAIDGLSRASLREALKRTAALPTWEDEFQVMDPAEYQQFCDLYC
ncbi:hypothetical protein BEN47_15300 [Hymenobacter lapidarius]|uniref:Uncharacterized protein n=1 Tax=Hymenobacter lapidarius TaxID=1908237 RepID=A0A1G1T2I5_9BACT|nr:hypothetical protein [Hymenobacter lapidarius]OGX85082.1 hypothetical protein BEN47_15300 [Hymenobacter lapidarius]